MEIDNLHLVDTVVEQQERIQQLEDRMWRLIRALEKVSRPPG